MFWRRFAPLLTISVLLLLVASACGGSVPGGQGSVPVDSTTVATALSDPGKPDEDNPVATSPDEVAEASPSATSPDEVAEAGPSATSLPDPENEVDQDNSAAAPLANEVDEADSFVLIDRSNPAYVLYYHLPHKELANVRAMLVQPEKANSIVDLVAWETFVAHYEQYTIAHITMQDYPDVQVAEGIVALLERYLSAPFGLTWNGGIAFTGNDYNFAVAGYEAYMRDPAAYVKPVRAADPIHPNNHLIPLLGER